MVGQVCDAEDYRPSEEQAGLERTFRLGAAGTWRISGTVVARSAPQTAQLLWPLGRQVRVGASSVLADDPAVSGQFAFDGDPATSWLSARGDRAPALVMQWARPRTLSRIQVLPSLVDSRTPSRVVLEAGDERREVDLSSGGLGFFDALRTRELTVRFPMADGTGNDAPTDRARALPVGVGDLVIDGIKDLTYTPSPSARTGAACGLGPDVVVDGERIRTRVVGSIGDVLSGEQMSLLPCGGAVRLGAGEHRISIVSGDRFVPTTLRLAPEQASSAPTAETRSTEILRWDSTQRSVRVGAGGEALLRIPENVNAGWRATLDGKVLEQSALDGWQQAYRIPAGAGGVVKLVYTPDGPYRAMLLIGAVAGALLLVGAAFVLLRERRRDRVAADLPAALGGVVLIGPFAVPALLLTGLLGGLWPLLGAAAGVVLGSRQALLRYVAVTLIGVTGIVTAVVAHLDARTSWDVMDAVTGVAVGMLVTAVLVASPRRNEED